MKLVPENTLIDGHRIAWGVHGEGAPVVLLHGTPFYSHVWRRIVPGLVDAGYRVYLYDLLGFGHSERPRDPAVDTSVSAQLPLLLGLFEHWGLDSAHVVGHDIGGAIAQQLGVLHPARVDSLTLVDCVSYDSWPSPRTRRQMQNGLDNLIAAGDAEHRAHFREWMLSAAYDQQALAAGPLDGFVDMVAGPVGQGSLFQHQIMHYDPRHTLSVADRLRELGSLPVQIVWGVDDAWQVVDWAHRLHADIPGSRLQLLENCGHLVPEDQPEKLLVLIRDFIGGQAANAA